MTQRRRPIITRLNERLTIFLHELQYDIMPSNAVN